MKKSWIIILLSLAIALSACAGQPAAGPAVEDTAAPEVEPMGDESSVQPEESRYEFEGVSFALDPAIFSAANGSVAPEKPLTDEGPYWEVNPEYVSIALDGYPITGAQQSPQIAVYPVEAYRGLSSNAAEALDALQKLLAEKPADAETLPFLPMVNAGQVFHSNVKYLDFAGGSGVRYLTLYAQYPAPINNHDLFYTFQGLSADGRSFVSVVLPVSHPALPAAAEALSQSDMEALMADPGYYPAKAAELSALAENSFTPDLSKIDALIASLSVAGE